MGKAISKRLAKVSRDTKLSHTVPVQIELRTYGDVVDYINSLPVARQVAPEWAEIRSYIEGKEPATKPYTTRLIEVALKKRQSR
ncbi:hypothetical protein [Bradyrhizobium sp. 6(2017)]|uniref:hypothetical protein n=1 Tax=Bradyrhizobium sp. 6(2017) TaxID=1197460 RepID=UPI0013E13890|nr:hypothetical protein [Bradyrhizobium sp. 6(2017)]QIG91093.1 hypothetical protein G6P99_00190 [Bradyrhizobium sp. 6(2017)]